MNTITKIKDVLEIVDKASPSGLAIAFHIRLTSPDFLLQTYPKAWTDIYSEKGYVMVDPTVRWGFTEVGTIRWSDLKHLDDESILEQSLAYGMVFGVTIATDTGGSRSLASFSRADREYSDSEIAELQEHVQTLHDLTASPTGMDKNVRDELHKLSVEMTHPKTT